MTQSSMMVYQVNTHGALCTTFDISATCQSMVFGDAGGIQFVLLLYEKLGEIGKWFSNAFSFEEICYFRHVSVSVNCHFVAAEKILGTSAIFVC